MRRWWARSEVVILSTKPQDLPPALSAIAHGLGDRLLISVAAGVRLADLQELAGPSVALARVMPNTPSLVGKGAAAYALGDDGDMQRTRRSSRPFSARWATSMW